MSNATTATSNQDAESDKAGDQERVKFGPPKKTIIYEHQASQISRNDVSVISTSSWAPRPTTSDAASASGTSSMPSSYYHPRISKGGGTVGLKSAKSPPSSSSKAKKNPGVTGGKKNSAPGKQPSLTERLGNSAISSTLGILKLAGGVTLSTTGSILSPSLELTRNVVLPNLLATIAECISAKSPQRLKDWFRIVSASVYHVVAVIGSTERGSFFRQKFARVFGDFVDVISSDTSRQALMDGMACFIKFSEALHTPEFKAFLEQLGVLGCRLVDAAAMGKNKKLIHDFYDLIWSGVELANDPATTVAMAEVAAYLCHALEMEDAALYAIAKEREEINRIAAQKRRERDDYQKATYQDSYRFGDPNATVEEVILSALGVIQKSVEEANVKKTGSVVSADGELDNDIPGSVVLGSEDDNESEQPSRAITPPPEMGTGGERSGAAIEYNEGDEEGSRKEKAEGIECQDNIDVGYLRKRITKRAEATKQRRLSNFNIEATASPSQVAPLQDSKTSRPASEICDDGRMDIEDLASLARADTPQQRNYPLKFEDTAESQANDNNGITPDDQNDIPDEKIPTCRVPPLEGETPVAHFYRVLDQALTNQRKDSVNSTIAKTGVEGLLSEADEDFGPGALKKRIQSIQARKRVQGKPTKNPVETITDVNPDIEKFIKENNILVCTSVLFVLSLMAVLLGFACYGMYVFVFPPSLNLGAASGWTASSGSEIHVPLVIHDNNPSSHHKNEYVVRVIREVIHVNSKGETLRVDTQHQTTTSDEL